MSTQSKLDILIDLQARLKGIEDAVKGVREVKKGAAEAHEELIGFNLELGQIASFSIGDLVSSSIRGLISTLKEGASVTVEYLAAIEQQTIAFETLLGSTDEARQRIADLNTFAATTPFEFEGIVKANRQLELMTNGALAGAKGMRLVGDAAAAAGVPIEDAAFWIGRLYSGLQSGTPVGEATMRLSEMGLVSGSLKRQLDNLASAGILGREAWAIAEAGLDKFGGAMEKQARTWNGLVSTLKDTLKQTYGEFYSGLFGGTKSGLESGLEMVGALANKNEQELAKIEAHFLAIKALMAGATVETAAEVRAKVAADIAANEKTLADLMGKIRKTYTVFSGMSDREVQDKGRNAPEVTQYNDIQARNLRLKTQLRALDDEALKAAQKAREEEEAKAKATGEAAKLAAQFTEKEKELTTNAKQAKEQLEAESLTAKARLELLDKRRAAINAEYEARTKLANQAVELAQKDVASATEGAAKKHAQEVLSQAITNKAVIDKDALLERDEKLARNGLERLATEKQIGAEITAQWDKIMRDADKALADQEATRAGARETQKMKLEDLERRESMVSSRSDLSNVEKRAQLNKLQAEELDTLASLMQMEEEEIRIQTKLGDVKAATAAAGRLKGYEDKVGLIMDSPGKPREIDTAKKEFKDANDGSGFSGMKEGMAGGALQWVTQLGTKGQQVAGALKSTLGTAVSGISQGIYGWITGSQKFGDVLRNMGATIFQTMLQTIIQMGVQWLVTTALVKMGIISTDAVADASRTARVAKEAAANSATTASAMPAAAATSVSSFGVAAVLGIAALVAAMAMFGGFETGGYTSGGPSNQVAGLVHAGEWVAPQWMVNDPSTARIIGALEAHRASGGSGSKGLFGFELGGFVAPSRGLTSAAPFTERESSSASSGAASRPLQIVLVDSHRAASRLQENTRLETQIMEITRRNRRSLLG